MWVCRLFFLKKGVKGHADILQLLSVVVWDVSPILMDALYSVIFLKIFVENRSRGYTPSQSEPPKQDLSSKINLPTKMTCYGTKYWTIQVTRAYGPRKTKIFFINCMLILLSLIFVSGAYLENIILLNLFFVLSNFLGCWT